MSGSRWRFVEFLVLGAALLLLALLVLPVDTEGVRDARRAGCRHHLRQIGLALQAYHGRYGSFPPAYLADEGGRRLHSWRTLILPFLEQKTMFNSIWLEEPWYEERNLAVLKRLQQEDVPYACPETDASPHRSAGRSKGTSYLAVIGANTGWPGEKPTRLPVDFPDGPHRTILVVEVENSDIAWTEPRDLLFEELIFTPKNGAVRSISSKHTIPGRWSWSGRIPVVNVLFADGSVRSLPADTSAETIRALLTRNGGERVSPD